MELTKQIYSLLESEEREGFIKKTKEDAITYEIERCFERVIFPAYETIIKGFGNFGRQAEIFPPVFSVYLCPSLRITVPNKGTFRYWVKVKHRGETFCIKRQLSIEGENGKVLLMPKRQIFLGDDLS